MRGATASGGEVASMLNQGSGESRGRLPQVAPGGAPRLPGGRGVNAGTKSHELKFKRGGVDKNMVMIMVII